VPQTINTNLVSLNAQRNLSTSQSALSTSMQRLSSGLRVNSAKDDAAGLAIAERMHTQVRGMNVAMRNANDGISLAQVAEGALGKTSDLFQRMRELAVQAANGTNSEADRLSLNEEFTQLAQEATRTLAGTTFNNTPVLASSNATVYQIGANNSTSGVDQISIQPFDWAGTDGSYINAVLGSDILLGTNGPTSVISGSDGSSALLAITAIDSAINQLNSQRGTFGAVQNRLRMWWPRSWCRQRTRAPHAAASWMPTTRPRPPACRVHRSCSRPAMPWWRRPTSCRSRCCRCCSARHSRTSAGMRGLPSSAAPACR
jgi:flagellin